MPENSCGYPAIPLDDPKRNLAISAPDSGQSQHIGLAATCSSKARPDYLPCFVTTFRIRSSGFLPHVCDLSGAWVVDRTTILCFRVSSRARLRLSTVDPNRPLLARNHSCLLRRFARELSICHAMEDGV